MEPSGTHGAVSRRRKLLYGTIVAILVYGATELGAASTFFLLTSRPLSFSEIGQRREALLENAGSDPGSPSIAGEAEVIHPYLGYVMNPEVNSPQLLRELRLPISDFGFIDDTLPVQKKRDDTVIIGVFGGSVAYGISVMGLDALLAELEQSPVFAGKNVTVVRVAMGGYKQPQQLIALSYLLSLGAEFDIVINVDGFNEVALPPIVKSASTRGFPFYPRSWAERVEGIPDLAVQATAGKLLYVRDLRQKWARLASAPPWTYSATLNLLWEVYDRRLAKTLEQDRLTLFDHREAEHPYVAKGPDSSYASMDDLAGDLADVWRRSSLQMDRLCRANGIRYYHFLQPNQYVTGSKPMGKEEIARAVVENHPYSIGVRYGYPRLVEEGRALVEADVAFSDLTQLFADHPDPLYIDTCCHVNDEGNRLLGSRVGREIASTQ